MIDLIVFALVFRLVVVIKNNLKYGKGSVTHSIHLYISFPILSISTLFLSLYPYLSYFSRSIRLSLFSHSIIFYLSFSILSISAFVFSFYLSLPYFSHSIDLYLIFPIQSIFFLFTQPLSGPVGFMYWTVSIWYFFSALSLLLCNRP